MYTPTRKRSRAEHQPYDTDTKLLRLYFPTSYQKETFDFLFDFFMDVKIIDFPTLPETTQHNALLQFPTLRIDHESISTCPFLLSECSMDLTTIIIEVQQSVLYAKCFKHFNFNNIYEAGSITSSHKFVISDEICFELINTSWKEYVFVKKYINTEKTAIPKTDLISPDFFYF